MKFKHLLQLGLIFVICSLLSIDGLAQKFDIGQPAKVKVTSKPKYRTAKKIIRRTRPQRQKIQEKEVSKIKKSIESLKKKEKKSKYQIGVSYSLSTDLNQAEKQKSYGNSLSLDGSYSFNEHWSIGADIQASYVAYGNEVEAGSKQDPNYLSDIGAGVSYGNDINKTNKYSIGFGYSFPTSPTSQEEGIVGIPSAYTSISSSFFDGVYKLSNSLSTYYIINRYESSPATGELNSKAGIGYGLSNSFKLTEKLGFSIFAGIRASQYLDNSTDILSSSGASIGYSFSRFSSSLSYKNGNYLDRNEVDLWYVDQYRQFVSFSLGTSF